MKEEDNFMRLFKYYKSNNPKPSYENVIVVGDDRFNDKVIKVPTNKENDPRLFKLGLKKFTDWQIYSFTQHPGLYLIRNPFTSTGQRYWIRKCLEDYPRKPNKTNIDIEMILDDWWRTCFSNGTADEVLLKKLRWTTLGYHHNWDTKVYSDENRSPFPPDLAELSDIVAQHLGFTFLAQAAIVNYYHMKSTLSAHTDHSEVNLEAPLFSYSFGQSAIFLIGGQDKSETPSPILLQSGDIMIMSKEARLCYHAVPKIVPSSSSPWNEEDGYDDRNSTSFKYINEPEELYKAMRKNIDDEEWSKFRNYVENSRINMNVRQVLNKTQNNLTDAVFS